MDGQSFLPVLENRVPSVRDSLYFEMGYTRGVLMDDLKYIALRYPPAIADMSEHERQSRLDTMNDSLRDRGRPIHTEDASKPFGHLMPIPGGHDAEQGAIKAYPDYYEPDQLYILTTDPNEQNNRYGENTYQAKSEQLKNELESYLLPLPGLFPLEPQPEEKP